MAATDIKNAKALPFSLFKFNSFKASKNKKITATYRSFSSSFWMPSLLLSPREFKAANLFWEKPKSAWGPWNAFPLSLLLCQFDALEKLDAWTIGCLWLWPSHPSLLLKPYIGRQKEDIYLLWNKTSLSFQENRGHTIYSMFVKEWLKRYKQNKNVHWICIIAWHGMVLRPKVIKIYLYL